jgi:hypothetical protein
MSTLDKDIDNLSVLIDRAPQIVLHPINLHEYLICIEGITIPGVAGFQSSSAPRAKLVTP